jgi:hypothetical protein
VEQAQIDVTVILTIAVNVMNFHHILCREGQSTFLTFALPPFQEFDHP